MGKIFRAYMRDSNLPVRRQLIASFNGTSFVAEREGDMLNIFLVSSEPLPLSLTGDSASAGRMTAARMQELSERSRRAAGGR